MSSSISLQDAVVGMAIIPYFWRFGVLPDLSSDAGANAFAKVLLTDETVALDTVRAIAVLPTKSTLQLASFLSTKAAVGEQVTDEEADALYQLEATLNRNVSEALAGGLFETADDQADGVKTSPPPLPTKASEPKGVPAGPVGPSPVWFKKGQKGPSKAD